MITRLTVLICILLYAVKAFTQEENWDVYMAQYEKGVGSTVINMSLKAKAPIKQFPYLLKAGVTLIHCDQEGLPVKVEFETLYQISDSVKQIIDAATKNKFSGTFSYLCERTDYYYVNDTTELRKLIMAAFKSYFPNYQYAVTIKADEDWKAYLTFLYPNEETLQFMSDEKVILNLNKEGDDLSKPRQVDHWLYFKTATDRDNFIAYAISEKFKVENKQFLKDAVLKYQLQISRKDFVNMAAISKLTSELRKKAVALNGNYDGWETFVIKE